MISEASSAKPDSRAAQCELLAQLRQPLHHSVVDPRAAPVFPGTRPRQALPPAPSTGSSSSFGQPVENEITPSCQAMP